ncbi:hypothetical protein [Amycolatopsis panacis]|uniref:hypothetical protein n=1 Tax=Amycolatopsis panacis TaxID=2340917 RepID=UPI001F205A30|nr:hypothetical protein [Amycolatopsis panacis]
MAPNQDLAGPGSAGYAPPSGGSVVPLGSNSSQSIVNAARSSSGGFEMGGDRAIANPPNWNSQASQQLFNGAVTDNDPGTAEATGQHWSKHGTELKRTADELYNAIAELGNAWVGEGAASAQGALVAIANSGSQASDAAHTMADRMAKQAAAAAEVKKMPAPREFDPKQAMAAALAGGPAAMVADQKAQADAADDVKAQQVAFFNAYTEAMTDVDGSTPSFGPESLGMKATATHFNGNSFNSVSVVAHPGSVQGLGGVEVLGGAGAPGLAGGAHGGPAAHGTHDSGSMATAGFDGGLAPGAAAGAGTGASVPASAASVSVSSGGSGAGTGAALGLGVAGAGAGLGKLGQGSRSASRKSDNTAASSEHQSGQSAASATPQQQGVVSAGGTIGGQNQPAGMAPGMGGGMGAHGGQGREDEEHTHASFLIEPDPDDAFGANEATPPPVIGAWSEDEED